MPSFSAESSSVETILKSVGFMAFGTMLLARRCCDLQAFTLVGFIHGEKVEEPIPMSDRHPLVRVLKAREKSPMYKVLFRQATSYGNSAKLLSELVLVSNNPDFVAPVLMCKVFAVELLLKFFLVVDYRKIYNRKDLETHHISFKGPFEHEYEALFDRIPRKHKAAIIKSFSKIIAKATSEKEFCVILSAFEDGFIKWRYVHEEEHQNFLGMRLLGQIGDALWTYANLQVLKN